MCEWNIFGLLKWQSFYTNTVVMQGKKNQSLKQTQGTSLLTSRVIANVNDLSWEKKYTASDFVLLTQQSLNDCVCAESNAILVFLPNTPCRRDLQISLQMQEECHCWKCNGRWDLERQRETKKHYYLQPHTFDNMIISNVFPGLHVMWLILNKHWPDQILVYGLR